MKLYSLPIIWAILISCSCIGCVHPFSEGKRMSTLLLQAEEMDRNNARMDTIQFLPEVLDYYKHHGSGEERMRSYYLMGCVYRDKGNSPQALAYYQDAISGVDTSSCNHLLLSEIYGQMALLYHYQRVPQREFSFWNKSRSQALLGKDSLLAVQALQHLSSAYYDAGLLDSFFRLSDIVYDEYNAIGRTDYAASSLITYLDYYLKNNDIFKAKSILEEYTVRSNHIVNGVAKEGYELIYYYKGRYYENVSNLDSALYYYHLLASTAKQISLLGKAYDGLQSVYLTLGVADSVAKYTNLFAYANDSANFQNSANEIRRAEMLYNFADNQNLAIKKSEDLNRLWRYFYVISGIVIVMVAALSLYIIHRRSIQKQDLCLINQRYNDALTQYMEASHSLDLLKKSVSERISIKEAEINELRRVLKSYQENSNKEQWETEQSLFMHEIVKRFHNYTTRIVIPEVSEWTALQDLVEKSLPEFYQRLCQSRSELTEKEFRACLLMRLHFIPSEIAVLLEMTKQRVTNMRGVINRKLFQQIGAKTVDQNLNQLS